MKTRRKKLTAKLLALSCIPLSGINAAALEGPTGTTWGTMQWGVVHNAEQVEDHGLFSANSSQVYASDRIIILTQRSNYIRMYLREGADQETSGRQIAEVLDVFYPGILANEDKSTHRFRVGDVQLYPVWNTTGVWELNDPTNTAGSQEISDILLRTLAEKHLITQYYGWGETADYAIPTYNGNLLDSLVVEKNADGERPLIDWKAIRTFFAESHPDCEVETIDTDNGTYDHIKVPEEMTLAKQVELAGELYEQFAIRPVMWFLDSEESRTTTGKNSLERSGDANLDCKVDIIDVIAVNKYILGVGILDNTGLKNADMDGNGTADDVDSMALLKSILEINDA